jgi:excisionase family DNA binding protein
MLFEPDAEQQHPPEPPRARSDRKQRRAVAPSRALSQPAARDAMPASSSPTSPALLTTAEAADVLRVHPRTVQRLVERGQLDAIHIGAAVRFDAQDVADMTLRLKRSAPLTAAASGDVLRPSRPVRIRFADRLRSRRP